MLHSITFVDEVIRLDGVHSCGNLLDLGIDVEDSTLNAVGAVGAVWQVHLEELELVNKFLHVRIVLLIFIEDQSALAVEGFKASLYSCGLVTFLTFVCAEVQ